MVKNNDDGGGKGTVSKIAFMFVGIILVGLGSWTCLSINPIQRNCCRLSVRKYFFNCHWLALCKPLNGTFLCAENEFNGARGDTDPEFGKDEEIENKEAEIRGKTVADNLKLASAATPVVIEGLKLVDGVLDAQSGAGE